jgi:hypothetical protein
MTYSCNAVNLLDVRACRVDPWFAVGVKSNFVGTLAALLRERGYTQFLSTYWVRKRWSDRFKNSEKCLFPRYVLSRFSSNCLLPILGTTGMHLVGTGHKPAAVADVESEALQMSLDWACRFAPRPFCNPEIELWWNPGPWRERTGNSFDRVFL